MSGQLLSPCLLKGHLPIHLYSAKEKLGPYKTPQLTATNKAFLYRVEVAMNAWEDAKAAAAAGTGKDLANIEQQLQKEQQQKNFDRAAKARSQAAASLHAKRLKREISIPLD